MRWLKYLWLPVSIAFGVLAWILFRERTTKQIPDPKVEIRAIRAEVEAKKLEIELGKEKALQKIEEQYQAEREKLTESQQKRAEELRSNPDRLAAFLIRAAR
jgi:predicted Holliday junction resolvase-like endonuclease